MLVQLQPMQITDHWPFIRKALQESIPPIACGSAHMEQNTLEALLAGDMTCWAIALPNPFTMLGYVITTLGDDKVSKVRNLIIYALYGFRDMPNEIWEDGFFTLKKYAQAKHCHRITAYTDNPRVLQLARLFGGSTQYTYVTIDLEGEPKPCGDTNGSKVLAL